MIINLIDQFLTPRQLEIFTLYGELKEVNKIARLLSISEKTVLNHQWAIIDRLGFRHTHEFLFNAICWVHFNNIIQGNPAQ